MVGTSGMIGERFSPVVAIARSFFELTGGNNTGIGAMVMSTSPEMRSVIDCELPLYGIWVMSVLVMLMNNAVARCVEPPMPADA